MTDATEMPTSGVAPGGHPNTRPRDASTLILLDRTDRDPKVLLGRRHSGHVFMPDKLVFPGGRVDPTDHRIMPVTPLAAVTEQRLVANAKRSVARARALGIAAIRELYEETGLCLGSFAEEPPQRHDLSISFGRLGLKPDLGALRLVARAVTPPGRVRRYDTFFFAADAGAVRHSLRDVVGTETELVELIWLPLSEANSADIPAITRMVLADLQQQLSAGFSAEIPVPFYHFERGSRHRDLF